MKPGIYDNMANAEYHGSHGISKTGLDLISKSPAHYKWAQEHPREETPSMQKGMLIHTMVLEPSRFTEQYVVMPETIKQKRGKEWAAFKADCGAREIVTAAQMEDAHRIVTAVLRNPVASRLLEADAIEQSIFVEEFETSVLCKCRPDIRVNGALYDLKTARSAAARSFSYSCRSYRYHVQAAFYLDVCRMQGINVDQFGFIVVDTDARPYQCTVFHRLADEAVELGRHEYMEDLRRYADCLVRDEWPGYPNEYEVLSLSGYAWDESVAEGA